MGEVSQQYKVNLWEIHQRKARKRRALHEARDDGAEGARENNIGSGGAASELVQQQNHYRTKSA